MCSLMFSKCSCHRGRQPLPLLFRDTLRGGFAVTVRDEPGTRRRYICEVWNRDLSQGWCADGRTVLEAIDRACAKSRSLGDFPR